MSNTTAAERDGLRYTPGNGYVYGWRKGDQWIRVYRVVETGGVRVEVETTDVIAVPATRTGTALVQAVNEWRERTR